MSAIPQLNNIRLPSPLSSSPVAEVEEKTGYIGQRILHERNALSPLTRNSSTATSPRRCIMSPVIEFPLGDSEVDYYNIITDMEKTLDRPQPDPEIEFQLCTTLILSINKCLEESSEPPFKLLLNVKLIQAIERYLEFNLSPTEKSTLCDQLIKTAEGCLKLNPSQNVEAFLYGSLAFADGEKEDYDTAIKTASRGLEMPFQGQALRMRLYFELAHAHARKSNDQQAIKLITECVQLSDHDSDSNSKKWCLLASCLNTLSLFEDACLCASIGLKESTPQTSLYIELAKGLFELGEADDALEAVNKGLRHEPSSEEKNYLTELKRKLNGLQKKMRSE